MMLQYSNEQLATIVGVPIITLLLIWTVTIFHKNRKKWSSYDIGVVAILVQSILRNLTILAYTALIIVKKNDIPPDYCKVVVWIFNSVHTFQASSLTTLAVIALFTVRLYRKQQNLQQFLTPTHVIYHLFCLTTLCACVGVAAILAQDDNTNQNNINFHFTSTDATCKFMPFELDIKFNIFIIVLHIFLAMVSLTAFIFICFNHLKMRRHGFDYLKKSSSDLSELSLSLTASVNDNAMKNFYDTYTIQRLPNLDNNYDNNYEAPIHNRETVWNSDLSNFSMTVSSTNSKRPCLKKPLQDEEENGTGLYTMYPILTVCYLFNHLPLIVISIFPKLISPWPVSGAALWMGQLQDLLIPIGLGLIDARFCKWVSEVYKCSDRCRDTEKIPPVGVDGKFRHFGSQPQSLEVTQSLPERIRPYNSEPKFPITNGSLYTSIDGRLPIIHNYRRPKDKNVLLGDIRTLVPNSLNLHSSHLKRQEYVRPRYAFPCTQSIQQEIPSHRTCEQCESPSSTQSCANNFMTQPTVRHDVCFSNQSNLEMYNRKPLHKRMSVSEDSLYTIAVLENISPVMTRSNINRPRLVKNKRNKLGARISKSQDCLNDLNIDLHKFNQSLEFVSERHNEDVGSVSSDDEYFSNSVDCDATSQSSYSITTEANCDFEFYQSKSIERLLKNKERSLRSQDLNFRNDSDNQNVGITMTMCENETLSKPKSNKTFGNDVSHLRITRSNSKRSLENFQAYIEEENDVYKIQRSNSFISVDDCKRYGCDRFVAPNRHSQKNYTVNSNVKYLQDVYNQNSFPETNKCKPSSYSCSVPDFKKVFISEYI